MDIRRMFTYDYNSKSDSETQHVIIYTSSDDNIVTPYDTYGFDANIVSNNYIGGQGIISFDGPITSIGYEAFCECDNLTSVTIPNSVMTIGSSAFAYCFNLTSVTIPDSVTTIEYMAFSDCTSLTNITIPESVTTIGDLAFSYCTSLTSVTIPDSVTSIGGGVFEGCTSLTSVTIPDSVTSIGNRAFNYCTSLKEVYCKATTPPSLGGTYVFDYNGSGRKIYVPAGSVYTYKSAAFWSEYTSAIVSYNF